MDENIITETEAKKTNKKLLVIPIVVVVVIAMFFTGIFYPETINEEIVSEPVVKEDVSTQEPITYVGKNIYSNEVNINDKFKEEIYLNERTRYIIYLEFDNPVWFALYDENGYLSYNNGVRGMAKTTSGSSELSDYEGKFDVNIGEEGTYYLVMEGNAVGDINIIHTANI